MENDLIHEALIAFMDNSHKTALEYLSKVIDKNNKSYDGYLYRGCTYLAIGDYEKAILDFNKCELLQSGNFDIYYNRGKAYLYNMELNYAIKDFNDALAIPNLTDDQKNSVTNLIKRLN